MMYGNCSEEDTSRRLARLAGDRFYIVELSSKDCVEYQMSDFKALGKLPYEEWVIQTAERMYKKDAAEFFGKMELKHILSFLEQREQALVIYYRLRDEEAAEYCLSVDYCDDTREKLILLRRKLDEQAARPIEMDHELLRSQRRFQVLLENLTEDFVEVKVQTGECRMYTANSQTPTLRTLSEQIAWSAENIIVPEERDRYIREYELENLIRSLRAQHGSHSAVYMVNYDGNQRCLAIESRLVREPFGREEEFIYSFARDITALREQEERNKQLVDISQQLLNISQTEAVTGLYNRTAGEQLIREHLESLRSGFAGTFLFIDIDYFKKFNDQYGHPTGDFVLKYLATGMRDVFRSDDILCRWGGDEFVIFMRGVSVPRNIESRLERLRARMIQCRKGGLPLAVTISIGGTVAKFGESIDTLMARSDRALYQVKEQGRNSFLVSYL